MRKLTVIGLLCIYVASQVGSVMLYYYKPVIHAISFFQQQQRIRQNDAAIKDITLSIRDYRALVHEENEIMLNGILHDIKKITYKDTVVHLRLLEDQNETRWLNTFASFASALQKQQGSSEQWHHQIWKWLLKIYSCDKECLFVLPDPTPVVSCFAKTENAINSFSLKAPGQPPESKS